MIYTTFYDQLIFQFVKNLIIVTGLFWLGVVKEVASQQGIKFENKVDNSFITSFMIAKLLPALVLTVILVFIYNRTKNNDKIKVTKQRNTMTDIYY